jgi:hypothetical protein
LASIRSHSIPLDVTYATHKAWLVTGKWGVELWRTCDKCRVGAIGDRLLLGERPPVGQDLCREDRRARALRSLPLVRRLEKDSR